MKVGDKVSWSFQGKINTADVIAVDNLVGHFTYQFTNTTFFADGTNQLSPGESTALLADVGDGQWFTLIST